MFCRKRLGEDVGHQISPNLGRLHNNGVCFLSCKQNGLLKALHFSQEGRNFRCRVFRGELDLRPVSSGGVFCENIHLGWVLFRCGNTDMVLYNLCNRTGFDGFRHIVALGCVKLPGHIRGKCGEALQGMHAAPPTSSQLREER